MASRSGRRSAAADVLDDRASLPGIKARAAIKRIKAGLPAFGKAPPARPDTVADVAAGWPKRQRRGQGACAPATELGAPASRVMHVLAALARSALHGHPAQRRCRPCWTPSRTGTGGWRPISVLAVLGSAWRAWFASQSRRSGVLRPSSRECAASRRRPAQAQPHLWPTPSCAAGVASGRSRLAPSVPSSSFLPATAQRREKVASDEVVGPRRRCLDHPDIAPGREGQPGRAQAAALGHDGAWAAAAHGQQPVCLSAVMEARGGLAGRAGAPRRASAARCGVDGWTLHDWLSAHGAQSLLCRAGVGSGASPSGFWATRRWRQRRRRVRPARIISDEMADAPRRPARLIEHITDVNGEG